MGRTAEDEWVKLMHGVSTELKSQLQQLRERHRRAFKLARIVVA
jgi:hypothetical protein